MTDLGLIPMLFLMTLVVVLLIGIWQFFRVRRSQKLGTPAVKHGGPDHPPATVSSNRAQETAPTDATRARASH